MKGDRSGTFWPFWKLMQGLVDEDRAPKIIVLENVCGTLTSHAGKDFSAICSAFTKSGYFVGAVVVDAVRFVPQSRARLFVIGVRADLALAAPNMTSGSFSEMWHPRALLAAYNNLPTKVREKWLWWKLPLPEQRTILFADLIEDPPSGVEWHTADETAKLLRMMSDSHREKVDEAKYSKIRLVGTVYKRTRRDVVGRKVQRAEIRFDDVAGCLRTPAGGSSRQVIVIVDGNAVKSRLISPRETARLMGLSEDYELPANYNEAYHLTGDGVVVPVVRHLARHIFEPLISVRLARSRAAA